MRDFLVKTLATNSSYSNFNHQENLQEGMKEMVRDSKQSLSIANVPALTLLYTGTGTATAALAANTLTIARANVHAFNLKYTGTGTCNAYVDDERWI